MVRHTLDRIGEGRVEIVDDLGEAVGWLLVAQHRQRGKPQYSNSS